MKRCICSKWAEQKYEYNCPIHGMPSKDNGIEVDVKYQRGYINAKPIEKCIACTWSGFDDQVWIDAGCPTCTCKTSETKDEEWQGFFEGDMKSKPREEK